MIVLNHISFSKYKLPVENELFQVTHFIDPNNEEDRDPNENSIQHQGEDAHTQSCKGKVNINNVYQIHAQFT